MSSFREKVRKTLRRSGVPVATLEGKKNSIYLKSSDSLEVPTEDGYGTDLASAPPFILPREIEKNTGFLRDMSPVTAFCLGETLSGPGEEPTLYPSLVYENTASEGVRDSLRDTKLYPLVPKTDFLDQNQKPSKFKEKLRLQKLLAVLNRHGDCHWTYSDMMELKDNNPSQLLQKAIDLHIKRKNDVRLTVSEQNFVDHNRGFIYQSLLENWYQKYIARYSTVNLHDEEVEIPQDINQCAYCEVVHIGPVPPHSCASRLNFSPQQWKNMDLFDFKQTKMVLFGRKTLLIIPFELEAINVGTSERLNYTTGFNLDVEINKAENSFYQALLARIKIAGFDNKIPIFCEFANSSSQGLGISWEHHAIGFMRVLKNLQRQYIGPLIMVIPPVQYTSESDLTSYNEKKLSWIKNSLAIRTMGQLFGIPVLCLNIQTFPEGEKFTRNRFWKNEAIFNKNGIGTLEYFSGLAKS